MQVLLCDVGPRDGLQNEPEVLPSETRAELVDRLVAAGLRRIEAVSFVRADRVPQMADAEDVIERVGRTRASSSRASSSTSAAGSASPRPASTAST